MDIHRCFSSRKRKQVRRACLNCQKAHSGCGEQRPCPRCVKRKEEHKCVDAPRRKRKDLPLGSEEGADSDGYEPGSPELVIPQPTELSNKRKRKLSPSKAETCHAGQHSDDDDCCSNDSEDTTYYHKTQHQQHPALVVRNNKRPRRNKWPAGAAFFTPTNLLAFPTHDVKAEQQPQQHQQYHQPQQTRSFEQVLSQKLTLLEQPPTRTQYVINKKELEDSTFLFNPQEFDCVSPDRQQPQQQPQHQQQEDLSLEWLMPELYLWGSTTTTTTTTSTATPGLWGQEQQQQQLPASSFYLAEDTGLYGYGGVEETPFFADYRTFEPLFSF